MKKLFTLFITLLLFSCSTEENGSNSVDPFIGVWKGTECRGCSDGDGTYVDYTITVNSEFIKSESLNTSDANIDETNGLCTKGYDEDGYLRFRYDVSQYTWENTGDDFTRQQQTYAVLQYSDCGYLKTYEDEEEKEYYTEEITFIFNSDFTEFYGSDEAEYEDKLIFYKVGD